MRVSVLAFVAFVAASAAIDLDSEPTAVLDCEGAAASRLWSGSETITAERGQRHREERR